MSEDSCTVRVAVRIRPQLPRETIDGCQICTSVSPDEPQVWIGANHSFTYDNVFDIDSHQQTVFDTVKPLIDGCMEGYNATILAYGQTGSGKTYTMGTGFEIEQNSQEPGDKVGIIPRALHYLFEQIERQRKEAIDQNKPPPLFKVSAQFVELYNEEVFDLIEPASRGGQNRRAAAGNIKIHEDAGKGIFLVGVGTKDVKTAPEALKCLRDGALCRTTAATNMNDQSSRSHAIFTMHVTQQRVVDAEGPDGQSEFETLSAKFHFVDLAGSERLKRTGAVGERAKEGISINCGLLSLGNVISALGDPTRVKGHVPYRDSKLTRLLQDSLGGNSKTVMIACVSPSDGDFVETLNTLKYANRAKDIKNKITLNQDKSSRTIALLRQEIQQLQNELMEYKQGRRLSGAGNDDITSDSWRENTLLRSELANLKSRIKAMQETIDQITAKNAELLADRAMAGVGTSDGQGDELHSMVKNYLLENEQLRAKLCEAEAACESLRKSGASLKRSPVVSPRLLPDDSIHNLIREAKREVEKEQNFAKKTQTNHQHSDEGSNSCDEEDDEEDDDSDQPDIEAELELAEITNDITVKQRLIEQLEATQRKFETMKAQYEEKLMCLSHKIKATEQERDKVLCTVKGEKGKQVKQDYEQKITSLNQELKKLQAMHKEHLKQLRNNSENEKRIQQLRNELDGMKRLKVKLMNQIKDENVRWREKEAQRLKEINQLKKDQRKKDNAIRTLQGEARMKELILKRKHEELVSLKKNKNMSSKVGGKVQKKSLSPVKAKHQWNKVSSSIMKSVTLKQTVANSECEMLALIEERKELQKQLTALQSQKRMMQNRLAPASDITVITDDIEAIQAKILYISEKTAEIQESIVELSAGREDDSNTDIGSMVSAASLDEMKYMFLKLYDQNISSMTETANAVQKENSAAEKLRLCESELTMLRDLFQHVMLNCKDENLLPPEIAAQFEFLKEAYPLGSMASSVKSMSASSDIVEPPSLPAKSSVASTKARRITSTPSDLLLGNGTAENGSESAPELVSPEEFRVTRFRGSSFRLRNNAQVTARSESNADATFIVPAQPQPSSRPSSNGDSVASRIARVNSMKRPTIEASAVTRVRGGSAGATNGNATDRYSASAEREQEQNESPNPTPPGSPNSQRRQQNIDNNVFQRLFQSSSTSSDNGGVGTIKNLRAANLGRGLLINEAVAEGHTQQVLSLYATETRLYSAAKDTFAKIWDLQKGAEIQTLYGHPHIVQCVTANEENNLVVTASSYLIKVWDSRARSCVVTLTSAGLRYDQAPTVDTNSRILQCPQFEYVIRSLCLGTIDLYSTYHDRVRRWDLRAQKSVGVLPGRHNSAVTSLLLLENGSLVTGSKDHSVRVYENRTMDLDPTTLHTAVTQLEPPHYDGVECFALNGTTLFSGSRDMCIKKWDVERKQLAQSINNAHGSWITGLAMAPNNNSLLLSAGKDGIIKVWNVEDGRELYKVDTAKRGLSCIVSNSSQIFTGCQDGTINVWKLRKNHHDLSPDSSGSSDISA